MDVENKNDPAESPAEAKLELKDKRIGEDPSGDLMDRLKNFLDLSFETIRVVIVSLIIIFVVRSFVIQPFFVKGASMEPNFQDGDYLIVDEIGYRLEKPARGDVIIFKYPNDPSQYFIKRVIGLPGESVEIKDSKITIFNAEHPDGFVLDEEMYLPSTTVTSGDLFETMTGSEYFVLGDNRIASSDSRRWGKLDQKFIIGKAWVRAWPFNEFKVFEGYDYQG